MVKFSSTLLIAALWLGFAAPAMAGEAIVNSEVSVDVTGKDAAEARERAMAKGEIDALTDLLGKLAPPGQAADIVSRLDAKKVSSMVRGTEVLDEKISADRYRARLLVSFDADSISALIGKLGADTGQDDSMIATSSFLVLTSFEDEADILLWEEKNPWRNTWKELGIEITSGDIVVPYGDNNDMSVVNAKTLPSANYATLSPLAIRYGVSDIIVLQANYAKNPDMTLTVIKRRINRSRNEVNVTNYRADPQETRDMLLARAARDIADSLQSKKVEESNTARGVRGGERNKIMLLAAVSTLRSWTDLRAKLAALPMVDRVELLALSPQQVDMVLYYRGSPESLSNAIVKQNIRLMQHKQYWTVSRD